ncbi:MULTISPECIES: hypothetical protein [Rhizobium/Agrobacterium group]|jgi:hypothetical protein|uniref:Uncharacterized protein n=1 Tax=Agrobacterium genomosp. 2 str. CFBP 5494 TaxID=1183436 RepID=A0A9W5B588_9HYPH|nr:MULTISPECIES: hypothetical protein [Rhizobium/Agrobacterium group]QSZ56865.1 hypothetical protein BTN45_06910 [Rhizobium sp. ZX09]CUW99312.1 conserved hypothetical protein [Agrobacterium genomosp. 2 str. CFBP 5494]
MTSKKTFTVTARAGLFVAGVRSPGVGKPIELTDEQAAYPLIAGEIEEPGTKTEPPAGGTETTPAAKAKAVKE